jgi:hypothetical protein
MYGMNINSVKEILSKDIMCFSSFEIKHVWELKETMSYTDSNMPLNIYIYIYIYIYKLK